MCANSDSKSNGSAGKSEDGPELEENLPSSSRVRPMKRQRCTKVDRTDAAELVALESEHLSNGKIDAKTSSGNNSLKLAGSTKMGTIKETNATTSGGNNSLKLAGSTKMATIKETDELASHYLAVGSNVEVLSQDSGIRGCWFRASVIKKSKDKVKVQYFDLLDAEDEAMRLEEWILASRIVVPDDLGLRLPERTKIRPQTNKRGMSFVADVGYIVDAWWHDGWWEGIVIQKELDARYHAKYHVYFPGEKAVSIFGPSYLRHSRDWTGKGWVKLRERPDIVASKLSLSNLKTKQNLSKSDYEKSNAAPLGDQSKQTNIHSGFSERDILIRKPEVVPDLLKDVLLSQLRWKSSRKRNQGGTSQQKEKYSDRHRKLSPSILESDDSDSFAISASLKVDQDDYKYQGDPSIFSSSVVPSLTNMVMCR
ncbi:unnamed protein product [Vicia faba]|uniref:Agenet domain-containing protein n=1 Tax=Vicia faba TaxID=3906 RepID=A0AAV0ZD10_VICFA|nr:unnamed protein product [Vicia faba]